MASHPNSPRPYTSSEAVLNAISRAQSSSNNPRGIECVWNAPYLHTLLELFQTHPESAASFLVNAPYSIWLPSHFKNVERIRRDLAERGLDYDRMSTDRVNKITAVAYYNRKHPLKRSTDRAEAIAKRARKAAIEDLEREVVRLNEECLRLKAKEKAISEAANRQSFNADVSIESAPDIPLFEEIPDIFVTQVASVSKSSAHYKLHAGRKIYYQTGALVLELKRGPAKRHTLTEELSPFAAVSILDTAKEQLRTYCSAYFACFSEAESIVAIATSGKHWQWANINRRQEVPEWNFTTDTPKNSPYDEFDALFGDHTTIYDLGTERSDSELMKIYLEHLYPMHAKVPKPDLNTVPEDENLENREEEEFVEEPEDESGGGE